MFYLIHILLGAIIGLYFPNLLLIFLASIVFHFVLDMLPHWDGFWDKKDFRKNYRFPPPFKNLLPEIIDISVSLIFISLIFTRFNNYLMIFGALCSVLPDAAKLLYFTPLIKLSSIKSYLAFHTKIQNEVSWKLGILIQALLLVTFLKIIF